MRRIETHVQGIDKVKPPHVIATQVSRATQGLREMLLRGEFHPGERIAEIPLSIKLGVSRSPLRLAFEKLAHEGLIRALPRSGFTASAFSTDDIWEALETRAILEGAAARLAAERLKNAAQLEPLRRIHRAVDEILNLDIDIFSVQYHELNISFHSGIFDLAGNGVLRRAMEQIYKLPFVSPGSLVLLYKSVPASKEIIPVAQEHHRSLIEAIEHREGSRAESLAREHCGLSRRNLELVMADRTLLESVPGAHLIRFRNNVRP